ncbi:DUF1697 domain-containing protein [Gelidibacter sp.]|uniref:DUF1697 domain-containing protein n=1 Tax=Gelidibacter sp. TaxID=2018083 RepID=UPI0032636CD5
MTTFVALLKGINIGGHHKIPMAELRQLLIKAGFQNVQTYIQSGNVIFHSSDKIEGIEDKIQKSIHAHFGFEVSVIVKTHEELQIIFEACPFSNEIKEKSYFIMFSRIPDNELVEEVSKITFENETFVIKKDGLYFYNGAGYGQAKFNMNSFERKLNVTATARNYNTMVKLLAMSSVNEKDH